MWIRNIRRPGRLRHGHRVALAILPAAVLGALALAPAQAQTGAAAAGRVPAASAGSVEAAASTAISTPAPGAGDGATVTVSKVSDLVNQTVLVSWKGFRPSSASRLQNSGDSLDVNTENPVRVYECRGAAPSSSSECYGSPGFRGITDADGNQVVAPVPAYTYPGQTDAYAATPDGPANWQDNITRADGSGEVSIQLFTKRESASLGCDDQTACSIVVVPNYGRPDTGNGDTEDLLDAPWAWNRATVVPLHFLPVDDACPLTGASLRVEGSPVAAAALASWRARTCVLPTNPVRLDYTAIGEPQTRGDVASATSNTGLLIDPMDADAAKKQAVVYAPVAVTGLVVAFQIDDADGQPVTSLKLDPRLIAKLITASYRSGTDPAVAQNKPVDIFRDPEFLQLNPGVKWPGGAPGNHPLILGDLSDTTSALTRYLQADKDARDFLAGKPDPWGMTVNANYKGITLPFASFPLLDANLSGSFAPIQELSALDRQLSIAQFPGGTVSVENGVNVTVKPPRQNPGAREVIGIIDAASAQRFRLATASLENAAGAFVAPSAASMTEAINHAKVNADGVTRQVDLTDKDPRSYPLTLQISAAVSTKAPAAERTEMAHFLTYAAGPGQTPGDEAGDLPPGHAPLTPALRKQTLAARKAVLAGYTAPASNDPDPDPSQSPSPTPSSPVPSSEPSAPGSVTNPPPYSDTSTDTTGTTDTSGTSTTEPPPSGTTPSTTPSTTPDASNATPHSSNLFNVAGIPAGARQMMLPLLGLLALIALFGGPAVLWMGRTGRGPQWLRR